MNKSFCVVLVFLWAMAALPGCAKNSFQGAEDSSPSDAIVWDSVVPRDQGLAEGGCPGVPCGAGYTCQKGVCVKQGAACTTDDDCIDDSYCDKGFCVPYGPTSKTSDTGCKGKGFTPEQLVAPTTKCSWTKDAVIMAPVVGDLDGDKTPEIVFVSYSGGSLTAIRGDTCAQVFQIAAGLGTRSQLALADLTGDKVPELIGVKTDNRVVVFDNKGQVLATAANPALTSNSSFKDGGAAIADLDGQAPPEIVYAGQALRYQNGQLTQLFNVSVQGGTWGVLSAVADVDLDGTPDVVSGNQILDGLTGADKTPAAAKSWPGGYTAVAQFDATPEPEIVLISSQTSQQGEIRIYHPKTGQVVFGPYSFGQKWGGPPTVADFDGDGKPEVAAAGYVGYAVFDPDCAASPLPAGCSQAGVRWLKQTKDNTSGSTGSSVFDFNGDGAAEVVYRDECWLRVYDGKTGQVRFAQSITSGTILELPVIADVDNDGHADVVVPSHMISGSGYCGAEPDTGQTPGSGTQGIFVLQDPQNRWMPSRAIWNQHTYHITNVNDDSSIPLKETNNWTTWNNYRQNTQGLIKGEAPAADLTGGQYMGVEPQTDCKTNWVLQAKLCNRGTSKAPAGVPGTFYQGDPKKGATAICTTKTTQALDAGQCETVKCTFKNPPQTSIDLWFVADDDGTGKGQETECKEKNNALHMPGAQCTKIG